MPEPLAEGSGIERCAGLRLYDCHQSLAKLFIRYPEDSAIVDAREDMQHRLDLCRIDVDAARNHHVALAIADEQIAVLVEVTDIAAGDKTIARHLSALVRLSMVREIGIPTTAPVDLANLARRQDVAGIVINAQLHARYAFYNRARFAIGILTFCQGEHARL